MHIALEIIGGVTLVAGALLILSVPAGWLVRKIRRQLYIRKHDNYYFLNKKSYRRRRHK